MLHYLRRLFSRIGYWLTVAPETLYLSQAKDVHDLERRIRELERSNFNRPYY